MKNKLLLILAVCSLNGVAQNFNIQSAADALKDLKYTKSSRFRDLSDAKKFIDLAADNSETSDDPRMWYYRGMIYLQIATDSEATARVLDPDAAEKSTVSLLNCLKTDKKKNYEEDSKKNLFSAASRMFNKAVVSFNAGDYTKAARLYSLLFDVFPYDTEKTMNRNFNITSDLVTFNLYTTYRKEKDNVKAKEYLQKLIDIKYNDPMIYVYMSDMYLEQKDTAGAIRYVEMGRSLFEENSSLLSQEIHIYALQGRLDVLLTKFSDAISLNGDNEIMYYNRGSIYEQNKDLVKAEADYKKAIGLKSSYWDANYSLGQLYFNQAAEMIKAANSLKSNEEFEKAKKAFELKLKEAQPYLEMALDVNPQKTAEDKLYYKSTLNSLKQIYFRTGENDKYNKVKDQLSQLGGSTPAEKK